MAQEQYDKVCKGELEKINRKLDNLHNRLFLDNGSPSFQTRLDRCERLWKATMWVVTIVCAASIAQVAKDIVVHLQADARAMVAEK